MLECVSDAYLKGEFCQMYTWSSVYSAQGARHRQYNDVFCSFEGQVGIMHYGKRHLLYLSIVNVDDNNDTMGIYTGSLQTSPSLHTFVRGQARIRPEKQEVNWQSSDNLSWKRWRGGKLSEGFSAALSSLFWITALFAVCYILNKARKASF